MFIPYKSISTKLALLNTYHNLLKKEYKQNFERLEFRDFTKEQSNFIFNHGRGYPIGYKTYISANHRVEGKPGWHIAPLFADDNIYYLNTQELPKMTKVLLSIEMTTVCAINILDPGQSLDWHFDKGYIPGVTLFRIIWGLDCGDQKSIIQLRDNDGKIEERTFVDKEFYIFHPETEHRVENMGVEPRAVLCIDYIKDPKYRRSSIL